jgi:hypothetical protein
MAKRQQHLMLPGELWPDFVRRYNRAKVNAWRKRHPDKCNPNRQEYFQRYYQTVLRFRHGKPPKEQIQ